MVSRSWFSRKAGMVALHVLAWGGLLALPLAQWHGTGVGERPPGGPPPWEHHGPPPGGGGGGGPVADVMVYNVLVMLLFYLNAYVLVPRFLLRQRPAAYALVAGGLVVLTALAGIGLRHWVLGEGRGHGPGWEGTPKLFLALFGTAAGLAYRLVSERIRADRLAQDRETTTLRNELAFLRGQISPHFLFNILNSAVALARKKSDLLEPLLLRLSSLMRYMLYESDESQVPLEREVEYVRAYIDLQLVRFGDTVRVNLDLPDDLGPHQIEPMLLIPFVENAFKHGVGMIEDPVIDVELRIRGEQLTFGVRNRVSALADSPDPGGLERNSGIGLGNVERRLKLLYGPGHTLLIDHTADWFTVTLSLSLR